MISFVNFARIASICVGFDLGTLDGYFSHQDLWPNLNFPLEYQIKLVSGKSVREFKGAYVPKEKSRLFAGSICSLLK